MANSLKIGFLFDLDGVLIDSEYKYSLIWKKINEDFPTGIENLEDVIKGTTLPDILSRYYPDEKIRAQVAERCVYEENNMIYDFCNGAINLLTELKANNYPIALVTSSDSVKMNHLWQQHPSFKSFFTSIIDAEKVTKSKPDPEGYLKAASELGIPAKHCIVFEDSIQGVKAGKAAGAYVIGINGTVDSSLLSLYADDILDSLENLDINHLIKKVAN